MALMLSWARTEDADEQELREALDLLNEMLPNATTPLIRMVYQRASAGKPSVKVLN